MPVESTSSKSLGFMNGRQRHSTNTYGANQIIIFGGFDGKTMLNDVYIIDISLLEENVIKDMVAKRYKNNFRDKLFNKKIFSDLLIKVGDKEIFAHKNILAAQCEKFYAMFTSEMSEEKVSILEIKKFSYGVVKAMLEYFYCAHIDIDNMDYNMLIELLRTLEDLTNRD